MSGRKGNLFWPCNAGFSQCFDVDDPVEDFVDDNNDKGKGDGTETEDGGLTEELLQRYDEKASNDEDDFDPKAAIELNAKAKAKASPLKKPAAAKAKAKSKSGAKSKGKGKATESALKKVATKYDKEQLACKSSFRISCPLQCQQDL